MSPLRKVARTQAKMTSYKRTRTNQLFDALFVKYWRDKGYPESTNKWSATKKGHKPRYV